MKTIVELGLMLIMIGICLCALMYTLKYVDREMQVSYYRKALITRCAENFPVGERAECFKKAKVDVEEYRKQM